MKLKAEQSSNSICVMPSLVVKTVPAHAGGEAAARPQKRPRRDDDAIAAPNAAAAKKPLTLGHATAPLQYDSDDASSGRKAGTPKLLDEEVRSRLGAAGSNGAGTRLGQLCIGNQSYADPAVVI